MNDALLSLQEVCFAYPAARPALIEVSLTVRVADCLVLAGPNGSGKTTLVKLAAGLLAPRQGRVQLAGSDVAVMSPHDRARMVAYMPQLLFARRDLPIAAREVIAFGFYARSGWLGAARAARDAAIAEAARAVHVERLLDQPVGRLSGGEIRKVHLARVLAQGARLVLLDEPTAHVDEESRRDFYSELSVVFARRDIALVMVVHGTEDIPSFCTRIVRLRQGRVLADADAFPGRNSIC